MKVVAPMALALLLALSVLCACCRGDMYITSVYTKTRMNGAVNYFVKSSSSSYQVTESIYNYVSDKLGELEDGESLNCCMDKWPGTDVYDEACCIIERSTE